jgi:phosphate-selective porin OprO/OprP
VIKTALLVGVAAALSGQAVAQGVPPTATPTDSEADADPSAAAAKIAVLEAQVKALQQAVEGLKAQVTKVTPTWKGAPQFDDKAGGWSFKPRGTMQFDVGFVGYPDGRELRGTVGGLNYGNVGFNGRARRLLFGAEGSLPGGFRYSAEFNFAQGAVDYEDLVLSYDLKNSPLTVQAGNFFPFSSLETMTSSRFTSFLERASSTDGFNYNRRLGVALILSDKKSDSYIVQAGLFNQPINDAGFTRTGWQASVRGVYSPTVGSARLHLGGSLQHRENARESQAAQYRSRPLTQITDQRFIDTGNIASQGDNAVGLEVGAVFRAVHVIGEAQKVWIRDAYGAGDLLALNGQAGSNASIPAGAVALNRNPSFTGGYLEAGWFLTGETRGYRGGRWDRTKVLRPFTEGGWGALQVNGRIDYLDLRDRVDESPNVAPPFYVNGGRQIGYQASLIWVPVDYVRLIAQYGHINVTGGPRAATVDATSTDPLNKRSFGVNTAAVRAQVDF